jgi:hypothetical protein
MGSHPERSGKGPRFTAPEERARVAQGGVRVSGREPWEREPATASAP